MCVVRNKKLELHLHFVLKKFPSIVFASLLSELLSLEIAVLQLDVCNCYIKTPILLQQYNELKASITLFIYR